MNADQHFLFFPAITFPIPPILLILFSSRSGNDGIHLDKHRDNAPLSAAVGRCPHRCVGHRRRNGGPAMCQSTAGGRNQLRRSRGKNHRRWNHQKHHRKNHSPARPDFLGASEPLWCGTGKTLLAGQPGCLGSIRYPMSANRLRLYGAGSFHLFQNRPANSGTGALRPGCHWLSSRANTAAAAPLPHCGSGEVSKASPVSSPEISLRHFRETDHLRKHPHPGTYKRCSHHGSWRNPCRCVCCCNSFSIP